VAHRPIREEPRGAPVAGVSPVRTLRPLLTGLLVILVGVLFLVGLGRIFREKNPTRVDQARRQMRAEGTASGEKLGAPLKKYPAVSSADQERLKDTIAVVETDFGRFALEFYPEVAPQTVQNFVWLVEEHFYDRQLVAAGSPGGGVTLYSYSDDPRFLYRLQAEFSELEVESGAVVLERTIDPGFMEGNPEKPEYLNSGSTRVWIALGPKPVWVPKYTVFGKVIEGLEVVHELSLTFAQGLPDYANEVLIYQVRLVPREQLQSVLAEPLEEPTDIPWAPQRGLLPPG